MPAAAATKDQNVVASMPASVSAIRRSATTRLPSSSFTGWARSSQNTRTVNHALSAVCARPFQGSRPKRESAMAASA